MNGDKGETAKIELEIPEAILRKIQAICELEEISQDEWLKGLIAEGIAREATELNGNDVEAMIETLKEIIEGGKSIIDELEEYDKRKED